MLCQFGDWTLAGMGWSLRRFSLAKAVPLAISRGTIAAVQRLELSISRDGITGRGETGGFETGHRAYSTDAVELELEVPFLFRPFRKAAIRIIEGEIRQWIARAEAGELDDQSA